MEKFRKIIIVLIAIVIVVGIYLITTQLTGTAEIGKEDLQKTPIIDDANKAVSLETVGSIGDLQPGQVAHARYTIRDPQTKDVKQVFGFSKLLRQSGDNWDIENPYMKMFEDSYTCQLTSDTGTVEIELVANQPTPKDARLEGNVVVELQPTEGSSTVPGKIYMDNVIFSSSNSQFSTEGPVRFISKDAEMAGTGMQLIYNSLNQRIEFLRIIDLEFIHFKNYQDENKKSSSVTTNNIAADKSDDKVTVENINQSNPPDDPNAQRYRCVVNDDVLIKYGNQHIYSDEVTLSNILFSQNQEQENETEKIAKENNKTEKDTEPKTKKANDDNRDYVEIFITCNGGITLRPMDYYENLQQASSTIQTSRTIEFKGQPVQIKQQRTSSDTEQIADCGFLKFDLDQEILDMTSYRSQKHVSLNFQQAGAKLKTAGSVHWQKRSNIAIINGPGTIYMGEKYPKSKKTGQHGEMDFMGMMKLYFSDSTASNLPASQKIKIADVLGGFAARLFDKNSSKLNADSARLIFDNESEIAFADLDGNVNVNSAQGDIKSSRAKVFFDSHKNKQNELKYIDLLDEVKAVSKGKYESDMQADYSRLHFNQARDLVQADLQGNVILSSGQQYLYTQNMEVYFGKDANDQTHPTSAKTLTTSKITSQTRDSSSFWAKQIEYDFTTGNAVAKGPVKFEFYTNPDNKKTKSQMPVVITAKEKAVFDSENNRITFVKNVVGKMIEEMDDFTRISDFSGDKLVVDLKSRTVGQSDIKHIKISGEKVKLKTQKLTDQEILNQVVLFCSELDYYASQSKIIAKGSASASEIQIDNSNAKTSLEKGSTTISLEKPCFGRIMFFDSLTWELDENSVIADGDRNRLYAGYVPVLANGQTGNPTRVHAGKIVAEFIEQNDGTNEISTVTASNGISYEDFKYQFEGGKLFYETGSSFVRITGSRAFDAMFNGVKVSLIEYNLNSGKATYEMSGTPGMLY